MSVWLIIPSVSRQPFDPTTQPQLLDGLGLVHVDFKSILTQTYNFQLVCYVVCDGGLGIKPEDRQQHWPQICEEWANVGVRSQLQNDLQPHEHLGGYRGALLNCDAGRVDLVIRFETPLIKCKTKC